jgi:hypothetical protein
MFFEGVGTELLVVRELVLILFSGNCFICIIQIMDLFEIRDAANETPENKDSSLPNFLSSNQRKMWYSDVLNELIIGKLYHQVQWLWLFLESVVFPKTIHSIPAINPTFFVNSPWSIPKARVYFKWGIEL